LPTSLLPTNDLLLYYFGDLPAALAETFYSSPPAFMQPRHPRYDLLALCVEEVWEDHLFYCGTGGSALHLDRSSMWAMNVNWGLPSQQHPKKKKK